MINILSMLDINNAFTLKTSSTAQSLEVRDHLKSVLPLLQI